MAEEGLNLQVMAVCSPCTRAAFAHRRFPSPSLCLFLGLLARRITAIQPRLGDLRQGLAFGRKGSRDLGESRYQGFPSAANNPPYSCNEGK